MQERKHQVRPLDSDIRTGNTGAILAKLIRTIFADIGIKEQDRYEALFVRYVQKAQNHPDAKRMMALRAGLEKELLKTSISWKTFMRGFDFLNVASFEFKIALERKGSDDVSVHGVAAKPMEDSRAGEVLASLLHQIFFDLQIAHDGKRWNDLIHQYIDQSTRSTIEKRQRATMRAGISKEIAKSNMTWKIFIKGLMILEVQAFTIRMEIKHANGKRTIHLCRVIIDGIQLDEESA